MIICLLSDSIIKYILSKLLNKGGNYMYDKINSLKNIVKKGLNVHKFYIPNNYNQYKDLINELKFCTIRTDHKTQSQDLPFYIFNIQKDNENKLNEIWIESQEKEYKLIISNGIQYDNIQEYNMVVRFRENGEFLFEASELKIPLRHMYRHPLLSCSGNLKDEVSQWEVYNARYGILTLYNHQLFNKWLEITKYPIPVGNKKENIIFWQIIDDK